MYTMIISLWTSLSCALKWTQVCRFYFFFETRPHTGFLPAAAASAHRRRRLAVATAPRTYNNIVLYYKNTQRQHVSPIVDNMESYIIIIIILKFDIGIPPSAECRLPSRPSQASQPAACWSRPVRHPSRRRPPVRDVRSVSSVTSASPAVSDSRVPCPFYKTSFYARTIFFSL